MYHVELRQFPHNFARFNMSEEELRKTILDGWVRGEWIELGERKWNPQQASLTVLQGPHLPIEELSMGRGWRNARRHGHDVTEQLLAARTAAAAGKSAQTHVGVDEPPTTDASRGALAADSLGLEVLGRLTGEPVPIALAWELARERYPEKPASDCLKLAEGAIGSLVRARLIVVVSSGEDEVCEPGAQLEHALLGIEAWRSRQAGEGVHMRRA